MAKQQGPGFGWSLHTGRCQCNPCSEPRQHCQCWRHWPQRCWEIPRWRQQHHSLLDKTQHQRRCTGWWCRCCCRCCRKLRSGPGKSSLWMQGWATHHPSGVPHSQLRHCWVSCQTCTAGRPPSKAAGQSLCCQTSPWQCRKLKGLGAAHRSLRCMWLLRDCTQIGC
jgi:hypothetical protein